MSNDESTTKREMASGEQGAAIFRPPGLSKGPIHLRRAKARYSSRSLGQRPQVVASEKRQR
jgi:hypothetical protein